MAFSLCACMPPDLRAFAEWDGSPRSVSIECVTAFLLIVSADGADSFDLSGHALKQIRQGFGAADIIRAGHGADDFKRRFVNAEVEFAPGPAFPDTVPAYFSLAFAVKL